MGKKQHSKDRLFVTRSEFASDWGGFKHANTILPFKSLPINCCALSLIPFKDPVTTPFGGIYDAENLIPYVKKYGTDAITGKTMSIRDIIPLKIQRNAAKHLCCPITNKTFNDFSKIVAIKSTGNVFMADVVDELLKKSSVWTDPLTHEEISSSDVLVLQDPSEVQMRALESFQHVRKGQVDSSRVTTTVGETAVASRNSELPNSSNNLSDRMNLDDLGAAVMRRTKERVESQQATYVRTTSEILNPSKFIPVESVPEEMTEAELLYLKKEAVDEANKGLRWLSSKVVGDIEDDYSVGKYMGKETTLRSVKAAIDRRVEASGKVVISSSLQQEEGKKRGLFDEDEYGEADDYVVAALRKENQGGDVKKRAKLGSAFTW